ncbi:RNA 3'-terminal phosphate cyclase [Xylariaceae sp. FL0804]|nr:RNA 3'-terminal phosphate cyclase [Xylariaceae sp. FL0804]
MESQPPLELDGRTGEGGGQLVRLACTLAAITAQPIRITHVRDNRERGGLKAQHVAAIEWLARATDADVSGLSVGSHTLVFRRHTPPELLPPHAGGPPLPERPRARIRIAAANAASSALLIFQAVFPYPLLAGSGGDAGADGKPRTVELEICGSSNSFFSPSYEYLDQVLLPTLDDAFGIVPRQPWDQAVTARDFTIMRLDVSMVAPGGGLLRESVQDALVRALDATFPGAELTFPEPADGVESGQDHDNDHDDDSDGDTPLYVLVVAHSEMGRRWGRDYLYERRSSNSKRKKGKAKAQQQQTPARLDDEIAHKVCGELREDIETRRCVVDEHLEDQLVVFQALAQGRTSFHRGGGRDVNASNGGGSGVGGLGTSLASLGLGMGGTPARDETHEPFGDGSTHTTTARWVASQLLPEARWFNGGNVCEGAGVVSVTASSSHSVKRASRSTTSFTTPSK